MLIRIQSPFFVLWHFKPPALTEILVLIYIISPYIA